MERFASSGQSVTSRAQAWLSGFAALLALLLTTAPAAAAQDADAANDPPADETESAQPIDDGPVFMISTINVGYVREHPQQPDAAALAEVPFSLGRIDTGYVAPREGVELIETSVAELSGGDAKAFHATGLQHVLEAIRDHLVFEADLLGVFVAPDPRQITGAGIDRRPDGETGLRIVITTGVVSEIRTIASGERVAEGGDIEPTERVNHPLHDHVLERSPIQPVDAERAQAEAEGEAPRTDLLRRSELDRYLFFLGRHPGRRVDASVGAAMEVGSVSLDYLVTENRPLVLYAQFANNGTSSTDYWRERFGLLHTQLTNNDDILSLDYTTANFEDVHTVTLSYEAPFPNRRVRWRVLGLFNQYNAQELGLTLDNFDGTTWAALGEVAWNFHQDRELFLDLVGGLRFERVDVERRIFGNILLTDASEDFIYPYVGLRLDRTTEWFSTRGSLTLEYQNGELTNVDEDSLAEFGRTAPDKDWVVLRMEAQHSFYLEPLIDREAWADPSSPESSTLAHEIRMTARGQYAFDQRLIPQQQQVVGGMNSVRGYPESVVAGDSAIVGSLEYRYHVPKAFGIEPEPDQLFGQTFRTAPQFVYGTPDWDLILKGFVDVGQTINSDKFSFEEDETLIGAGVGVEFLYRRNLTLRADWGFVLNEIERADVNDGSNRLHFVATILF